MVVNVSSTGLHTLHCGGNWNDGTHCGPRAVNGNNHPWNVNVNIGCRFACDLIKKIIVFYLICLRTIRRDYFVKS